MISKPRRYVGVAAVYATFVSSMFALLGMASAAWGVTPTVDTGFYMTVAGLSAAVVFIALPEARRLDDNRGVR